jgi:hypothetical protein
MLAIFRKRSRKFESELGELKAKAVSLVLRAADHQEKAHQVIETLEREIDESQYVIDMIQYGSILD